MGIHQDPPPGKSEPLQHFTTHRLQLREAGFQPIPTKGKQCLIPGWQSLGDAAVQHIISWERKLPHATHTSTGLLAALVPAIDVDIPSRKPVEAVVALIRKRYGKLGRVITRTGKPPKALIPFQTEEPFRKQVRSLVAPDGTNCKIEMLGEGQQYLVGGIHPDTKKVYTWEGGEPGAVERSELPPIDEAEAEALLDACAAMLIAEFGFKPKPKSKSKATAPEAAASTPEAVKAERFRQHGESLTGTKEPTADWGGKVTSILDGTELHDTATALAASLIKSGMSSGAAVNFLRELMDESKAPRDKRWQDRYDDIQRAVDTAAEKYSDRDDPSPSETKVKPHGFPDERTMPRFDFILGKHVQRGVACGTVAKGGTGKTILSIVEALAMTTGKKLTHDNVPRAVRVLLMNLEDDRAAINKRIAAAMKHYGLTPRDVGGRLFIIARGEAKNFKIAKTRRSGGGAEPNEKTIDWLKRLIKDNKIDVLYIDPLIKTLAINENDNNQMSDAIDCYSNIGDECACAPHLWHHMRKGGEGDEEAGVDSARGASALVDSQRGTRISRTMSKAEANKYGLRNHRQYFRVELGRATYSASSDVVDWYEIRSVPLLNGADQSGVRAADGGNGGDNIGVAAPWNIPTVVDDLSPGNVDAIVALIPTAQWRADVRAPLWVGMAVAQVLALDVTEPKSSERERVKQVVKKLIERGVLTTKSVWIAEERREKMIVILGR